MHREVALGLEGDVRVFPLLVGGAEMPGEEELPEGLRRLAVMNASELSDSRWEHDIGKLVEDLDAVPKGGTTGIS